ncbi:MAG: hypothetical protein IKA64_07215 [Clostridia bacterium]|nr:hypothetical protein [Clostridia bacterium]
MKKRIIALILVTVMALLSLVGCGYSYAKDDMSDYATMNGQIDGKDFAAALLALAIADGDFGTDETVRIEKVNDVIFTALAKEADTEAKKTEGTPDKYDLVYYVYYCTAEVKGETEGSTKTVTLFASNMKQSSAVKVQTGLYSNEGLSKDIADAVAAIDFSTYAYKTRTDGTVAEGDRIVVSYTKTYSTTSTDTSITKPATVTQSYVEIDANHELYSQLVGKSVNTTVSIPDGKETVNGHEFDVKYTGVKVQWVVENSIKIGEFTDTTYTASKKVKDVNGVEYDIKDVELTYHVFPVYFLETPALDADAVLRTLLGDKIAAAHDHNDDGDFDDDEDDKGSLEIFADLTLKYTPAEGDAVTLNALVEELAKLQETLTDAKKNTETKQEAFDKAKDAVDKAGGYDKATQAEKDAYDAAKLALEGKPATDTEEKVEGAKDKEAKAQSDVDAQIEKIFDITPAGEKTIKELIVADYEKSQYDTLLEAYKSELKANLAKAVYETLDKYLVYSGDLPKRAVNDMYDRLMNEYKYDYNEGNYSSTSSSKVSNYDYYKNRGKFLGYLIAQDELKLDKNASMKDAKAAVRRIAEDEVKEIIGVYVLADYYNISLTEEEIDAAENMAEYYEYIFGSEVVSKDDFIHSELFDKVMNHILEIDEDGEDAENKNKVMYSRVDYTIKEETEEDETEGE